MNHLYDLWDKKNWKGKGTHEHKGPISKEWNKDLYFYFLIEIEDQEILPMEVAALHLTQSKV